MSQEPVTPNTEAAGASPTGRGLSSGSVGPAPDLAEMRPALKSARRYSWPAFEPGHEVTMRHGAYSPRKLDPLIGQITAWVQSLAADAKPDSPLAHLKREERLPAILAWARAEARVLRFDVYVSEHGELDEAGNETAACQALGRWEDRAEKRRIRIGLDAQSEAQLREAYRERVATDAHAELLQLYGPQDEA